MADPLRGREIHLGGQTRQIRFTMKSFRIAQRTLNGMSIRQAVKDLDVAVVIDLAAAGFASSNSTITPERVETWLENEPEKFTELANAVGEAIAEAYGRMMPKSMLDEALGESTGTPTPMKTGDEAKMTDGQTSQGSSVSSADSE